MSGQNTENTPSGAVDEPATSKPDESSSTVILMDHGKILTPADLGAATYNLKEHSSIEPLFADRGPDATGIPDIKNDLAGLRIHNPDGSQITISMDEYKGHSISENIINELQYQAASVKEKLNGGEYNYPEEHEARRKDGELASTEDLRSELLEAYKRIAATDAGTATFTQNAQYFNEASWTSPKESEASPSQGMLGGNMRYKTPEEQDDIIYRQHELLQQVHIKQKTQEQSLPHSKTSATDVNAQNKTVEDQNQVTYNQKTTLKEEISNRPPHEQEQILALVLEKYSYIKDLSMTQTDQKNAPGQMV
ncbi:MAG: hypothetical protein WBL28_04255 [Methylotenera sp.]